MSNVRQLEVLISRNGPSSTLDEECKSSRELSDIAHDRYTVATLARKQKFKRKFHVKKKTGCITCKIRRVRCDEAKPGCNRCISFGIRCEGYTNLDLDPPLPPRVQPLQVALLPQRQHQPVLIPSLSDLVGTPEEKASFDFFRRETSFRLSGHFDARFWTNLLLQIGHAEPIIWHSVLALSKLHEQYMLSRHPNAALGSSKGHRFALQHYNISVARLKGVLSDSKHSIEVISVNCILFASLELLLGNTEGAMAHVRCGTQILRKWQEERLGSSSAVPYSELMDRYVIPVFGHMNLHASIIYGTQTLPKIGRVRERTSRRYRIFQDLIEARAILLDIENEGLELANPTPFLMETPQKAKAALMQKQSLLSRSREWGKAFDALLSEPSMRFLNPQDSQKAALLKVQHQTAAIWISKALNADETTFDNHVTQFEEIINLAEYTFEKELALLEGLEYADFSVHMQIISLYYVTIKCRNSSIRRRALTLLKQSTRTEGFWDSNMVIRIAERVIEIEEAGLESQTDSTGSIVPSEWARIQSIGVTLETVGMSRTALVCFRQRSNGDIRQWLAKEEHFKTSQSS